MSTSEEKGSRRCESPPANAGGLGGGVEGEGAGSRAGGRWHAPCELGVARSAGRRAARHVGVGPGAVPRQWWPWYLRSFLAQRCLCTCLRCLRGGLVRLRVRTAMEASG